MSRSPTSVIAVALATIAAAGHSAIAFDGPGTPFRHSLREPPKPDDHAERIAAAEAKRARKNAKRLRATPTATKEQQ